MVLLCHHCSTDNPRIRRVSKFPSASLRFWIVLRQFVLSVLWLKAKRKTDIVQKWSLMLRNMLRCLSPKWASIFLNSVLRVAAIIGTYQSRVRQDDYTSSQRVRLL